MDGTQPEVTENRAASRFEIRVDGKVAGFTDYHRRGSTLALNHTEIDSAFEGRGLGSALARGALEAARTEGAQVLPYCPFVRSYLQRHPEYADLVPADRRAEFGLADPAGDAGAAAG